MNILFLSLIDFENIDEHNIYTDLLREFWKAGHNLYVISPVEKRTGKKGGVYQTDKATIIKPVINDMQKVGYAKKVISMFTIEPILVKTIKKYLSNTKIDLVLYATPPITFQRAVSYVKNRDNATTYLLQKDIFPEGLLDLEVLTLHGWKGLVYKYYREKEKKLLKTSDYIGCMSQANIDYIKKCNPFLNPEIIELCPNSIDVMDASVDEKTKKKIREKYAIPEDKTVFVYGGNLGQPQGIPFLIECLRECKTTKAFFLIIGDGTEYSKIEQFLNNETPQNVKLLKRLPKSDYDSMVGACDVGMIFLDHRFNIPNIPSRLLSYMEAKMPVVAVTDASTDLKDIVLDGKFGYWCESNNKKLFRQVIEEILNGDKNKEMGKNAYGYLEKHFSVKDAYQTIIKHL